MIDDERYQSDSCEGELLSLLLESRDEATGVPLAARELREQVLTLVMAGHETVGVTLSWTWYLLSLHPDVAHLLREELSAVLGGRPPTADDLPRLEYTAMVIAESMRLYPPAWCLERMPVVDDELAGHRVQAGSTVFLVPYVTHRHPDFWQNPEGFDPQRFTPKQSADRPRFAYFPFGGGPRQCIGNSFALMEAQLILATVAQRYELDLLAGHPVIPEPKVTLRPRYGMVMTLRPVTPQTAARSHS
jgi:cytochrome P450